MSNKEYFRSQPHKSKHKSETNLRLDWRHVYAFVTAVTEKKKGTFGDGARPRTRRVMLRLDDATGTGGLVPR